MNKIKIVAVLSAALMISNGSFAQRGRGHDNRYRSNQHYGHVYVNASPRYSYRPVYQPYYRPYYRSVPVYRPVVRPYYSSPLAFVHFGPSFGFRLSVLPFGYSRIFVGSYPYYYNDGIFYRNYSNGGGYEVVAPPLNAVVKKLPANAKVTVVNGQKYYQVGGTFYQEEFSENNKLRYRVAGTDGVLNTDDKNSNEDINAYDEVLPTVGSRYDELPTDSRVQVINQQKYFGSPGGVYYKEVIEGDKIRYEVTTVQ